MGKLADLGVRTLRISDEMLFLNRKYYTPILQQAIDREFGFNMWTYSRVDTVREDALELFKRAGVNWLALGIEAGNQLVRQEVSKDSFKEVNILDVCRTINEADINIISNYIFGFPEDTIETMQETLDLALELNTEMANMYPCQALPGSPIYYTAKKNGWALPDSADAIHIEQNVMGEHVGSQDQIVDSTGSSFTTMVLLMSLRLFSQRIGVMPWVSILCFSLPAFPASPGRWENLKIANLKDRMEELRCMREMVDQAIDILQDQRIAIEEFGALLEMIQCR